MWSSEGFVSGNGDFSGVYDDEDFIDYSGIFVFGNS